jgi:hypothetical protein
VLSRSQREATPGQGGSQEHLQPPEQRWTELGASVSSLIARSLQNHDVNWLTVDDDRS